jgi:APA family basic amino acid/polyamine antiporter
VLGAIAMISTANTVLISLIAGSRLAFCMGRDREIPLLFAALLPGRETPWVAAILLFAVAELLVPVADVKFLAELSSLTALFAFLAVNIALIVVRYRLPDHHRPFRVPFAIGQMPIIPVIAIVSICLLMVNFEWEIYLVAAAPLLLSGLAYLVRQQWRRLSEIVKRQP